MIYIFDTNSLSNVLNHYYPNRFPTFWEKFGEAIGEGKILSVSEVKIELLNKFDEDKISLIENINNNFFSKPIVEELLFIRDIYSISHFQQNLDKKKLLQGGAFADPFIIAKAKIVNGIVVTEEKFGENAARIPNICNHFRIEHVNLEGFLSRENWIF